MRRLLPGLLAFGVFALVVFLAFGVEPAEPDTAPTPAVTPPAPVTAAVPPAAPSKTTETVEPSATASEELIALRRYEHLLNGRDLAGLIAGDWAWQPGWVYETGLKRS